MPAAEIKQQWKDSKDESSGKIVMTEMPMCAAETPVPFFAPVREAARVPGP